MLKGFKDFLIRGNVVELAVAVVVGVAFNDVITAFTGNLIDPLIAAIGGTNINGLSVQLVDGNEKSIMDFGAVITAGINFVIIAAVVYFLVVLPAERLRQLRQRSAQATPAAPTDVELLTEIRDLLAAQRRT